MVLKEGKRAYIYIYILRQNSDLPLAAVDQLRARLRYAILLA